MLSALGLQEILFVVVPLVLLLCWLLSLGIGKYRTNLILSMLLVLFDLPYTVGFLAVVSGRNLFGFTTVSPALVFGLICCLVGVCVSRRDPGCPGDLLVALRGGTLCKVAVPVSASTC
jgi:hypothetical protein